MHDVVCQIYLNFKSGEQDGQILKHKTKWEEKRQKKGYNTIHMQIKNGYTQKKHCLFYKDSYIWYTFKMQSCLYEGEEWTAALSPTMTVVC